MRTRTPHPATPGTTKRARYALGATVAAVVLALLAGAFPMFGGASADTTRDLVKVTFRPDRAKNLMGWRSDHGEPFDSRRAYGWVRDNTRFEPVSMADHATTRSTLARRTDTAITMQPVKAKWGRWVLSVAPGTYRVTVTVGDPSGGSAQQNLMVESTKAVTGFWPSRAARTRTVTVDVVVNDGRLTLDPLYPNRLTRTRLVSVVVQEVLGEEPPPTTAPPTTVTPTTEPTTVPPTTIPPTTIPPTTVPPTTVPPTTGLRYQTGFGTGGGFLSESDANIKREFDGMVAAGSTWVRLPILWTSIEQSPGVYWWSRQEQVVDWAQQRGLRVIANVSYTPRWARPASCQEMFCAPANVDWYARFLGDLVDHFSPLGVKHYEVWNEPNQHFWWKPRPDPARYAEMVRKAYVQAKRADPTVVVLAGVFAPAPDNEAGTMMNPRTFLAGMYRAGVAGHFDALAFHPYTFPEDPRIIAEWNMMTGVGPDLADMMAAHGDGGKKIWATEIAYPTGTNAKAVSETEQARLTRLAIDVWRQQKYAGPLIFFTYRDMGTDRSDVDDNFGLVKRDFTPKLALSAVRDHLTTR